MDAHTVRTALLKKGEHIYSAKETNGVAVDMFSLTGQYLRSFCSISAAVREIFSSRNITKYSHYGAAGHIADVCAGRRKTAYKYIWKYHADKGAEEKPLDMVGNG